MQSWSSRGNIALIQSFVKVLAVVCDNAANNDTLITELELLGSPVSSETRIRCFAHILNLVVKVCTTPHVIDCLSDTTYDRLFSLNS